MSLNKVMLIGNLGKDPDVRYLDNGVAVASMSIATTEKGYTAKNGTEVPDRTEWHNIILWRGLAETAEKYLHKGDKVYIEGSLRNRSYDDQAGIKRSITEVYADRMELLGSPNRQQVPPPAVPPQFAPSDRQPTAATQQTVGRTQQTAPTGQNGMDDLPF